MVFADKPPAALNVSVEWEYDEKRYEVELWDAEQESLAGLGSAAYANTDVFLLAYDMTKCASLGHLLEWLAEIQSARDAYCGIILVGTKYDLWLVRKQSGVVEGLVDLMQIEQVRMPIQSK